MHFAEDARPAVGGSAIFLVPPILPDGIGKQRPRPGEAGRGTLLLDAEQGGDVLVGKAVDAIEFEYGAIAFRQRFNHCRKHLRRYRSGFLIGRFVRDDILHLLHVHQLPSQATALPVRVEGHVDRDPRHPGIQRAGARPTETADDPEDLDESILLQVLGIGRIGNIAAAERKDTGAVLHVQFPSRCIVAPGTPEGQFLFFHHLYNSGITGILRQKWKRFLDFARNDNRLACIVLDHPDDGAGADGAEFVALVDAHAAFLDGAVDASGLVAGAFVDADLQVQLGFLFRGEGPP